MEKSSQTEREYARSEHHLTLFCIMILIFSLLQHKLLMSYNIIFPRLVGMPIGWLTTGWAGTDITATLLQSDEAEALESQIQSAKGEKGELEFFYGHVQSVQD